MFFVQRYSLMACEKQTDCDQRGHLYKVPCRLDGRTGITSFNLACCKNSVHSPAPWSKVLQKLIVSYLLKKLIMMIVSMGWDYISELLPPTGLLFVHHAIYEHCVPWWKAIDREQLLIYPPELSLAILSPETPSGKVEGTWRRKWWIRPYEVYLCSELSSGL
jgi:hypothetical protein